MPLTIIGAPSFFTDPVEFLGFLGSFVVPWSAKDPGWGRTYDVVPEEE
ncbi:uncharacterized protein FIBRA_01293 [Fibroporia radiculosa]|uniref:Uncharacterized protein n=1 Tax=Fibroporia radiculosa TaxID=599839 RepID=J4G0W8_9APHY|nr:uncharacterized protein FIBRA_01293 [Fibroporia radiculosa]CCL99278.1 predicted protein [Fibroporia radiculosa]